MILHPLIIALVVGSALVSLMTLTSSWLGFRILKCWDIVSGSELQIELEKKTYLVSTLMAYAFIFEILSFFLFIYTAEDLHWLFTGAMCAAGSLNANEYGYRALLMKIAAFILAGLWLVMNHADNRARDYPLIKEKYAFLLLLTPFVLAGTYFQGAYFLNLRANVITSCCGSLFGSDHTLTQNLMSFISGFRVNPLREAFYLTAFFSMGAGILFHRGFDWLGSVFSASSLTFFLVSAVSLVSFICLYIYELPTHHCPFCLLQSDYFYIGYLFYGSLLGGVISGVGVGILMPFRRIGSLKESLPEFQKKLACLSAILSFAFTALATWKMICSNFILPL
ncbi:MAG TPA: hypothetical protein PLS25_08175 [Methanoregulaceae archaeon]|jgi:hypothetical protein|nr:hypothetical protein [Methanoregulaceae archaeon]